MKVTRDVVVDLLPMYLAGEASTDTRALVEDYLKQDAELAERIRRQWAENLNLVSPSGLPPELELQSLKRTRKMLRWQRWLFGWGLGFAALGLSSAFSFSRGSLVEFHFLLRDYPAIFGTALVLSAVCFANYFLIKRQSRVVH